MIEYDRDKNILSVVVRHLDGPETEANKSL